MAMRERREREGERGRERGGGGREGGRKPETSAVMMADINTEFAGLISRLSGV
jgi:hypothetical protein